MATRNLATHGQSVRVPIAAQNRGSTSIARRAVSRGGVGLSESTSLLIFFTCSWIAFALLWLLRSRRDPIHVRFEDRERASKDSGLVVTLEGVGLSEGEAEDMARTPFAYWSEKPPSEEPMNDVGRAIYCVTSNRAGVHPETGKIIWAPKSEEPA